MMTIFFKRSGGFVGKGMRLQLDIDQLSSDRAQALVRLIDQAGFFNLPENLILKFNPNEYQYMITVDSGEHCHTVRANDSTLPASMRPLVDQLASLQSVAG